MNWIGKWLPLLQFRSSTEYWRLRYRLGGDSGAGSGGTSGAYKAKVVNAFVREFSVEDVIEFGCGDGRQLALAEYPQYLGLDISQDAVNRCRERFSGDDSKQFMEMEDYGGQQADLAISLDVLFHLVEDEIYWSYLGALFQAGRRYVLVYSTSSKRPGKNLRHVRHRPVEKDILERFKSFKRIDQFESKIPPAVEYSDGGYTRFFAYERI